MESVHIIGFTGENNVQDKRRLNGPTLGKTHDLAECRSIVNADISNTFSASLRPGYALTYTAAAEDMWATADESQCYFRVGNIFNRLMPDFVTGNPVWLLGSRLPLSYTEINYLIVCSNGFDLFIIENGVASYFSMPTEIYKLAVKSGHILAYFNRVLYIAVGNQIYRTDADDIQQHDVRKKPFVFNSEVTMMLPLENGMYVGADKVYWLPGRAPEDFSNNMAYDGQAIENTGLVVDGALLGGNGKTAIFTATDGICIGTDGGQVTNETLNKVSFTNGHRGAALLRKSDEMNQYIAWV
jgi:hypothetical protein